MTETVADAVGESTAPDANVNQPETGNADAKSVEAGNEADPSPAVKQADDEATAKVRSRIDELTKHRREAERERDHWREMAMRNLPKESVRPVIAEEPQGSAKTLADFGYDDAKYQSYLFENAEKRAEKRVDDMLRERQEQDTKQRRKADFTQRSREFAKTVEDFHEVIQDPLVPISEHMAEVITESEEGPALAYYLGKNREVAERIARLPPTLAGRELGRLEVGLVAEREKAKAKALVSKAPAPPPRIEAASADLKVSPTDPDSDKLSTEDWLKRRNKQVARKRN